MRFEKLLQDLINFRFIVPILIFFDQIAFFKQIDYPFDDIFLTHVMLSFHIILDASHSLRWRDRRNFAEDFLIYRLSLIMCICTCEVTLTRAALNDSTVDDTARLNRIRVTFTFRYKDIIILSEL